MLFTNWWRAASADEKRRVVTRTSISAAYLSQIAHGHRNAGIKTAHKLVRAINEISPESHLTLFDVRTDLGEVF